MKINPFIRSLQLIFADAVVAKFAASKQDQAQSTINELQKTMHETTRDIAAFTPDDSNAVSLVQSYMESAIDEVKALHKIHRNLSSSHPVDSLMARYLANVEKAHSHHVEASYDIGMLLEFNADTSRSSMIDVLNGLDANVFIFDHGPGGDKTLGVMFSSHFIDLVEGVMVVAMVDVEYYFIPPFIRGEVENDAECLKSTFDECVSRDTVSYKHACKHSFGSIGYATLLMAGVGNLRIRFNKTLHHFFSRITNIHRSDMTHWSDESVVITPWVYTDAEIAVFDIAPCAPPNKDKPVNVIDDLHILQITPPHIK
jgi:hypothetical protein